MAKLIGTAFQCLVAVFWVLAPLAVASYLLGDLDDNCRVEMADVEILAANLLTIDTDLPWLDGYYRSSSSLIALRGTANPSEIRAVRVAGRLARWLADTGKWSIGPLEGQSPTEYLLPAGSSWIWLDDGSNQKGPADGIAWYGHLDYNDLAWSGPAPSKFGYGDDGEVTTISFGPSSNNKFITTYFRTWFDVDDISQYASLKALMIRDNGAVVYLNGNPVPIVRDRISEEPFDYTTEADDPAVGSDDENRFFEYDVDPVLLVNGTNLIVAEVHQSSRTSSDLGFDLELIATRKGSPTDEGIALDLGANTIIVQTFADTNGVTTAIETAHIDVWFEEPIIDTLSGTLQADTVIGSHSIMMVTGDVIISGGVSLEIRAGAVLLF